MRYSVVKFRPGYQNTNLLIEAPRQELFLVACAVFVCECLLYDGFVLYFY